MCGNYAGWMSACRFFHVICLQYYRAYNHAHHSFQLHEESLYASFAAFGWMVLSFVISGETGEGDVEWIHWALNAMAYLDLWRLTKLPPFHASGLFGQCASCCSSKSRTEAPLNLPLLVERQQLFVILCLGEMAVTILAHPWFQAKNSAEAKVERGSLGRFAKISSFLLILLMIRFEMLDDEEEPAASSGPEGRIEELSANDGDDKPPFKFLHAYNVSRQRGAFYTVFGMLATFGILLIPAAMDLYALGQTHNSFAEAARELLLMGCGWITLGTSLQRLTHFVLDGSRRVSQGKRFGFRLLSSCLFAVIAILPWRPTSTFSYMFNPDILFPLSVVLVQAAALGVDLWSVGRALNRGQRWKRERIEDDDGRVGGGSGGRLRDILLEVEEEGKKG